MTREQIEVEEQRLIAAQDAARDAADAPKRVDPQPSVQRIEYKGESITVMQEGYSWLARSYPYTRPKSEREQDDDYEKCFIVSRDKDAAINYVKARIDLVHHYRDNYELVPVEWDENGEPDGHDLRPKAGQQ